MKENNRIPSLDGWRAISILLVIIGHEIIDGGRFGIVNRDDFLKYFAWHQYGVQVFFVISGFLITHLLLKEEQSKGSVSLKDFYIRRFFRIIPALFFYLIIVFLLNQLFQNETIKFNTWIRALFFMANFYIIENPWTTTHLWSLSVEEQYYLIWPISFIKKKMRLIIPWIFICLAPIFRIIEYKHPGTFGEFSFFIRTDGIFIGALFAIYRNKLARTNIKFIENVILLMTLLCLIAQKTSMQYTGIITVPFTFTLFSISTVILINKSLEPKTLLYKILNVSSLVWIGQISYSLYLWQQLFFPPSIFGIKTIATFPFNIICMFLCAIISKYLIEDPILKWRKRSIAKSHSLA